MQDLLNVTVLNTWTPFIFSGSESEASVLRKCQMTKQLNTDLFQPDDKNFAGFLPKIN